MCGTATSREYLIVLVGGPLLPRCSMLSTRTHITPLRRAASSALGSLKTTYYKKPVRDMSTEWIPGKILKVSEVWRCVLRGRGMCLSFFVSPSLAGATTRKNTRPVLTLALSPPAPTPFLLSPQVTYYRYFRFFGDGRVAYGLMHEGPKEFVRMLQVRSNEERLRLTGRGRGRGGVEERAEALSPSLLIDASPRSSKRHTSAPFSHVDEARCQSVDTHPILARGWWHRRPRTTTSNSQAPAVYGSSTFYSSLSLKPSPYLSVYTPPHPTPPQIYVHHASGGISEGGLRHLHHQQVGGERRDPEPVVLGELHAAAGERGAGPVHPPGDAAPQLRPAQRRQGRPVPPLRQEQRLLHGERRETERDEERQRTGMTFMYFMLG